MRVNRWRKNELEEDLLTRMGRLDLWELVRSAELVEQSERTLVDQAVFELLVTDELTETLDRLDEGETPQGRMHESSRECSAIGGGCRA